MSIPAINPILKLSQSLVKCSPVPCATCGGKNKWISGPDVSPLNTRSNVIPDYGGSGSPPDLVIMKNVPQNPLSNPHVLNIEDIPLVPHNQIVYLRQPYLVVLDKKNE